MPKTWKRILDVHHMIRRLLVLILFLLPLINFAQQYSLKYQIRYKQNKFELSEQNKKIVSTICDTLLGKTNYLIYINGHSDSDADSSFNQQLSLNRSLEVKKKFIAKGIDESFIRVQAKGEEQPLVANSTPLEKAKNRRVEIIVLFLKEPEEKVVEIKRETNNSTCNGDTTVSLDGGYVLTISNCDWKKNSQCLRIVKRLTHKFNTKESWLKKHIGFKNYNQIISYEPYYQFFVLSCTDSCFQHKMKLYIPHYNAIGLKITEKYSQKRNDKNQSTTLLFKKIKTRESAYYTADIYCPGILNCGTDNRCTHPVNLHVKNKISILSYSYYERNPSSYFDSLVEIKPPNSKRVTVNYTHAFFQSLNIQYNGDTINLKNIPIDIFAHGATKIKRITSDKSYFMFIPFQKKHKCGHYKKYKIRSKDIERLKQFNLLDL